MTYTKQLWNNGAAGLTPISAERLSHMENGIYGLAVSRAINLRDYLVDTTITAAQYQQAINDANTAGMPLYHPGGLTADLGAGLTAVSLSIPNNTTIFGDGHTSLLISAASDFPVSAFGSYAFMRNATFTTVANPAPAVTDILITGLRFRRTNILAGTEGPYDAGILMRNPTKNVRITNCIFESSSTGVAIEGGTDFVVSNCTGYSQSDAAFRVANGNDTTTGSITTQRGLVQNCWAINTGYALDGTSAVPNPSGPLGSSFVFHQSGARILDCGAINSRYNSIEMGAATHGMSINGFKILVDIPTRVGNILIADTGETAISNIDIELHNGGKAAVNFAGTIGTASNTLGQKKIMISNLKGYNDYAATGFNALIVSMAGDCSDNSIYNVQARGMGLFLNPSTTSTGNTLNMVGIRQAAQASVYIAHGLNWTVKNIVANDGGTDTSQANSTRVGIVLDQLGAGGLVTDNRSEGCQYAYYVNAGTISWDRNFGSGVVAAILKTNTPTLSAPTFVS